eukprot:CAMPEP_0184360616 /NCGR_PEP_ID=MMETSP1089-20130417/125806_1 /TAXON_ID=38269 ORGANISM="Gloeochaete wittrockiana, Strain SAG46.84" /NCGR_SAMPLE_ID=MMETSP1089 /ASSEMBLY_ACC=CAM_ASM_000445 /LENGTH=140 /DNA_ID=CAMNT_0026699869 /DNA_START=214 /DNA_END=634 /DNA_ORIENTATION=-
MARLVLLMVSVAATEVGEEIEADLAIRLWVLDASGLFLGEKSLVIMVVVLEGDGQTSLEEEGVEGTKGKTKEHAVLERGAEVPDLVEFLVEHDPLNLFSYVFGSRGFLSSVTSPDVRSSFSASNVASAHNIADFMAAWVP